MRNAGFDPSTYGLALLAMPLAHPEIDGLTPPAAVWRQELKSEPKIPAELRARLGAAFRRVRAERDNARSHETDVSLKVLQKIVGGPLAQAQGFHAVPDHITPEGYTIDSLVKHKASGGKSRRAGDPLDPLSRIALTRLSSSLCWLTRLSSSLCWLTLCIRILAALPVLRIPPTIYHPQTHSCSTSTARLSTSRSSTTCTSKG